MLHQRCQLCMQPPLCPLPGAQHMHHWLYLGHKGHQQMYLGIQVAAHRLGRRTGLDHLWGDPGQVSRDLGGGGGLHPSFSHGFQKKIHGVLPCIICPCIVHQTTRAWRYPKWLRSISALKGVHLNILSLLSCMGIRMDSAKWHPDV